MRAFEEEFVAWLDGALSKDEALAFEKEHPSILDEGKDLLKLRNVLKDNLERAELSHPDFFNAQIMAQIQNVALNDRLSASSRSAAARELAVG